MSKLAAFFISFTSMLSILLLAGCTTTASATQPPILPNVVVVEYAAPPGHIVIENPKVLKYIGGHNYTLFCDGIYYGAIDFEDLVIGMRVVLLSGQTILVAKPCHVDVGNPDKSIYVYEREPPKDDYD